MIRWCSFEPLPCDLWSREGRQIHKAQSHWDADENRASFRDSEHWYRVCLESIRIGNICGGLDHERWLLGLAAVTAVSVACGTSEDDVASGEAAATDGEIKKLFDVNDLSILFPLSSAIKVSESDIWSQSNFQEVTAAAKSLGLKNDSSTKILHSPRPEVRQPP